MHWFVIEVTAACASSVSGEMHIYSSCKYTHLSAISDNHLALRHLDTSRIVSVPSRAHVYLPPQSSDLYMCVWWHAASMRRVGQKTPDPFKCQITFYDAEDPWKANIQCANQGRASSVLGAFVCLHMHARIHCMHAYIVCTYIDRPTSNRRATGLVIALAFWEFRNRNGSSRRAFDARTATIPLPRSLCRLGISCANDFYECDFIEIIQWKQSKIFVIFFFRNYNSIDKL